MKKRSPSKISLIALLLFSGLFFNFFKNWKNDDHPFHSDAGQYYSYLVGTFIHGDLTFQFPNDYWLHKSPKGINVQKMTYGVAMMELPFFLIGHTIASLSANHEANGFSAPYSYSVAIGALLFVFLGLLYLRKSLLLFYSEKTTTIVLLILYLGTNLFYYSISENLMSHGFLFSIVSLALFHCFQWNKDEENKNLFLAFLFIGIATVTRPTMGLLVFLPLFIGIKNKMDFKKRIQFFLPRKKLVLFCIIAFILPIIPQMIYWKYTSGSFLYFSYSDEGFFLGNPKIMDFLFSYRKGWFVYTPIMLFGMIGLFLTKLKEIKRLFIFIILLSIYIISSWWCWWYGGSYGARPMVELYPLMAFGLASTIEIASKNQALKIGTLTLFILLSANNLLGAVRYRYATIHWDSMTKDAFWYSLFKVEMTKEERTKFSSMLEEPNYEAAKKGDR